jgi:hypothetical protein
LNGSIDRLLAGEIEPGIYRLDMSLRPSTICNRFSGHGWCCFYLDGGKIFDKQSLLAESARAFWFPDYFGHNWDALEECVTDLSWFEETGYVLLYDHAAVLVSQGPDVWATFYDILNSTVAHWNARSRPFYVLLRNAGRIKQAVPAL